MSYSKHPASVCLVTFSHGAVETEAYATRSDLILSQLNSGAIATDGVWGSPAHVRELETIVRVATGVLSTIAASLVEAPSEDDDG